MASFRYKAMTSSGAIVRGQIAADSEADAIKHLRAEGHFPIAFKRDGGSGFLASLLNAAGPSQPLTHRRLALVTQEMADLSDAGLDLDRVLGVVAGLKDAEALQPMLLKVRAQVREGTALADALAENPAIPRFYISMVRAGEASGQLAPTLRKLADYLIRAQVVRESVASALVYPIVLLVTAGLAVIFLLTFVLPSFEPLFANAGQSLPLPTQIVLGISRGFRDFWWLGLLLVGLAIWRAQTALKNPAKRRAWDGLVLRIPRLGPLLADIEMERFKRTLATLVASGVPLPSALLLSRDVLQNGVIAGVIADAAKNLREGGSLARQLSQSSYFPSAMIDLIEIGEETGRLDEILLRQADLDERRIRNQLDRLLALLVPALTITLGVVVAGLIASMLVAILSVNDMALQ